MSRKSVVIKPIKGGAAKARAAKLRYSAWIITINTNKEYNGKNDPALKKFKKCLYEVAENMFDFFKVMEAGVKVTNEEKFPNLPTVIPKVEVGKKFHRIHGHLRVVIKHRSKIHVNTAKIAEFVDKCMNRRGTYVNQKLFTTPTDYSEENIQAYLEKQSGISDDEESEEISEDEEEVVEEPAKEAVKKIEKDLDKGKEKVEEEVENLSD